MMATPEAYLQHPEVNFQSISTLNLDHSLLTPCVDQCKLCTDAQAPRPTPRDLPKPGTILVKDFRSDATKAEAKARPKDQPVKLLQWNIERGYKLPQIIEELKALDADVLALQEVSGTRHGCRRTDLSFHRLQIDIHCERSNWEDTGVAIAESLGLQVCFLPPTHPSCMYDA
jgi:hypothetical protein